MLILSQDKKAIHNFDNIINIQIEQVNAEYKLYVYDIINDNTSLAGYDTEERAKEVLQEIIKAYKESGIKQLDSIAIENKVVYEMRYRNEESEFYKKSHHRQINRWQSRYETLREFLNFMEEITVIG